MTYLELIHFLSITYFTDQMAALEGRKLCNFKEDDNGIQLFYQGWSMYFVAPNSIVTRLEKQSDICLPIIMIFLSGYVKFMLKTTTVIFAPLYCYARTCHFTPMRIILNIFSSLRN